MAVTAASATRPKSCAGPVDATAITDRDGFLLRVNPSFSALTGFAPMEALGKNPREFYAAVGIATDTDTVTVNDHWTHSGPEMRPGHYVSLRVTDTSIGVGAQTLEKIFEH